MPVSNEPYDQLKIERLKHYLEDMASKGEAKPFEIFVDNLKVVSKTEDPKHFESFEYYMNEDTQKIRILIYNSAAGNRNDQYCFMLTSAKQQHGPGLGEIDNIIKEKLAERDREHETARLKEELEKTKLQLEEAEEYSEQLREQLEAQKASGGKMHWGDLASYALEGIVRRNPQILQKLPYGEVLAGIIEQDNEEKKQLTGTPPQESTASFSKTNNQPALSQEQLQYVTTLQQLESAFDQSQLDTVMGVLQHFIQQPATLKTVAELLNISIK